MQTDETVELRWIFKVARRWAWLVIVCGLLALAVALFVTARIPPVYEATTTLIMAPAEQTITSDLNSLMAGEKLALTYVEMLKGLSILQTAISRLGLKEDPADLAKRVRIESVADTQLVRVTARGSSPAAAALLANTIADVSVEYAKTLQDSRYRGFLLNEEAKLEAQQKEMDTLQTQINAVTQDKIANQVESSRLQGQLAEHQASSLALENGLQALNLLVDRVKDNVKAVEMAAAPAPGAAAPYTATVLLLVDQGGASVGTGYSLVLSSEQMADTYARMITRRTVLDAAVARLGDEQAPSAEELTVTAEPVAGTQLVQLQVSGPDAVRTASLANALARVFVEQIQGILSKPYAERLASLQAQLADLEDLIDATKMAIQEQTAASLQSESELARLQASLGEHRTNYSIVQQGYDQARLVASQASGTIVITEQAQQPSEPTGNNLLYAMLAVVVAMMIGLGAGVLIEYLDESIKTPEDVSRALGLSTLGFIEQYGREEQAIAVSKPDSPAAEAFRMLATSIRLSNSDDEPCIVVVTSPAPGDGKTAVVANLAVAAASSGLRVIAVDADLRRPRLHELFGLNSTQGLTEGLLPGGPKRFLKSTAVEGLKILTSGQVPKDPVGVVSSPRMKKLLEDLAQEADLVIVDSPPALAVADATILAASADRVLLVLRAGHTATQAARRALGALRQTKAEVVGAILNGAHANDGYYGHYYKYRSQTSMRQSALGKMVGLLSWRMPSSSQRR